MLWRCLAVIAALGCGGHSLKAAGETCTASSECESGLLCDIGQMPAVCAGSGSTLPIDGAQPPGAEAGPDDGGMSDAGPIDAPVMVDAAVDAMPDAEP
jgi:hypothetical protein